MPKRVVEEVVPQRNTDRAEVSLRNVGSNGTVAACGTMKPSTATVKLLSHGQDASVPHERLSWWQRIVLLVGGGRSLNFLGEQLEDAREGFLEGLLAVAQSRTNILFVATAGVSREALGALGQTGFSIGFSVHSECTEISVRIGPLPQGASAASCHEVLKRVELRGAEIAKGFGTALRWDGQLGEIDRRVFIAIEGGYNSSIDRWQSIQAEIAEAAAKLAAIFQE